MAPALNLVLQNLLVVIVTINKLQGQTCQLKANVANFLNPCGLGEWLSFII